MKIKVHQLYVWLTLFILLASTRSVGAISLAPMPSLEGSPPAAAARQGNAPTAAARQGNAPAAAGDEYWDDQFQLGTYDSEVPGYRGNFAMAVSGTGVYIGGDFDHAGNVEAERIVRWDSSNYTWSALGSGVDNVVYAIAANEDIVYVGGLFLHAGGIAVSSLASWNNSTHAWSALGGELELLNGSPVVYALAIAGNGDVYVGGKFDTAGGVPANNIARWDGSSWHALGSGTEGTDPAVYAIAINGSDVYVGGRFDTVGGASCNNIAAWGSSAWSCLGSGTGGANPTVMAIAIDGTHTFIGGEFTEVTDASNGLQAAGYVAMWDTNAWNTLDGGLNGGVATLTLGPDGIYAGGRFELLANGTKPVRRLARWDGAWYTVGGSGGLIHTEGVDSSVYILAFMGDQLFVGGHFTFANTGRMLKGLGYFDISDDEWYALGNSVNETVYALAIAGEDIYLGGRFSSAGGLKSVGVARWNQRTGKWSSLLGGVSGCMGVHPMSECQPMVMAIAVDGKDVYVGGNFTSAGGVPANGIARWDSETSTWHALGDGVTCEGGNCFAWVQTLDVVDSKIYAGGDFDYAGGAGNLVNNLAVWDGLLWTGIVSGTNGTVYAIEALSASEVYIGGEFSSPSAFIARCTETSCSSLSADVVNGAAYAIQMSDGVLYVGGAFTDLGGPNGDFMTTFHDNAWHQLEDAAVDDWVLAVASSPPNIYAGGYFTAAGSLGMNYIGRYTAPAWSGFGSGVDAGVWVIASEGHSLYIGGFFLNAGNKPSEYFARNGMQFYLYLPLTRK